ncbi:MAG: pilus assembly protein PilM, partial [Deltaproteobacteria bacterium]|nr:pilus assembly protein PilM [Deltaproteobacteria bacterium]
VIPMRKRTTVGVDIGYTEIKMAMINTVSERRHELLDFTTIPFPEGIAQNSPTFPAFLKNAMKEFCGRSKHTAIWAGISAARVETRNIKIPKVSKKQIDNAVYWTLKKDLTFDENEMIFDFEIIGDIIEDGINKIETMAYVAPKQEVVQLKNLFGKIGFPLTGVSIVPFGMQNLLRTNIVDAGEKLVCSLFIGRDWSRIVIYSRGNLILSRGIKAGIRSMIEAVAQELGREKITETEQAIDPSESSIFGIDQETYIVDVEQARRIFFNHINGKGPVQLEETGRAFQDRDVFAMILPAVERLVKQVERTLDHYYLHFGNERMNRIFVSGQLSAYANLINYMRDQLDIPIDTLDPFSPRLNYLGIATLPVDPTQKESYAPAIGLGLSNNELTPNFIYTYKNKQSDDNAKRANHIIAAGIVLFIAICSGVYWWGNAFLKEKSVELAQLKSKVETFSPLVNKELIINLASQTRNKRKSLKLLSSRYKGMAVINELSTITPGEIKLLSITADFGDPEASPKENGRQTLTLEGIVMGDRLTFESTLAAYIVGLGSSPMFQTPSVESKSFKFLENKEVLQFRAMLDLV